jgi:ribosomal protein L37AE/L43A
MRQLQEREAQTTADVPNVLGSGCSSRLRSKKTAAGCWRRRKCGDPMSSGGFRQPVEVLEQDNREHWEANDVARGDVEH